MLTAADCIERTRPLLKALIDAEAKLCGSVVDAYKRVASKSGSSMMKVRRIVGRYGRVKLLAHEYHNICELHARYQLAVEKQRAEYEAEKVRLANLQGRLNELDKVLASEERNAVFVPRESTKDRSSHP